MIITEKEAMDFWCPMVPYGPLNNCVGKLCMAFTYADTRDGEDRYYCGMATCPSPRTNSGEGL